MACAEQQTLAAALRGHKRLNILKRAQGPSGHPCGMKWNSPWLMRTASCGDFGAQKIGRSQALKLEVQA